LAEVQIAELRREDRRQVVAPQPLQHQVSDAFKENWLGFGQPLDHLIGKTDYPRGRVGAKSCNTLAAGEHLDFPDDVAGPELGRQSFRSSRARHQHVQAALADQVYGMGFRRR